MKSSEKMFISNKVVSKNKISNGFAPIVLFTYNRLAHTKQTVEALQKNIYAAESELYIYSDGAKDCDSEQKIKVLREYLHQIKGFNAVHIIERQENWGLAKNIIDGVTKIVNQYGKIIVLEDDIVTSKYFLQYMNEALVFYQEEKKVMQISGTIYNLMDRYGLSDTFLYTAAESCGWATWKDRWKYFKRNPQEVMVTYDLPRIRKLIEYGSPSHWRQIEMNAQGSLCTWGVFFQQMVFEQNGLVLYPKLSLTTNIGFDGTGSNCGCIGADYKYATRIENKGEFIFEKDIYIKEEVKKAFHNFLYKEARDLIGFVTQHKEIFCYGAGKWGQSIVKYLKKRGIKVSGFVISDTEKKEQNGQEIAIYKLSELKDESKNAFILSLSPKFHESVKKNLLARNYKNIYAISGELLEIVIEDEMFY